MAKNKYNNKRGANNSKFDKRNSNGKGKNYRNPKERMECDVDAVNGSKQLDQERSNDISWHNKAVPLYSLSTKLPFNKVLGMRPKTLQYGNEDTQPLIVNTVPGIMAIDVLLGPGSSTDSRSAVNKAGVQIYDKIVSVTSGALQMQQADVMMLQMGTDSIASLIAYAKRVIESSNLYSSINNYLPEALLASMHMDRDTIVSNKNRYLFELNDIIRQFNNMNVLKTQDVTKRHYSLMHNIYADGEGPFTQFYLFRPTHYYVYNDSTETGGSLELHTLDWSQDRTTNMDMLLNAIRSSLDAWWDSSDLAIIKGNLNRAFPQSEFYTIDFCEANSITIPIMDRNILWQINNMHTVSVDYSTCHITQDPVMNVLKWSPKLDLDAMGKDAAIRAANRNFWYLNSFDGNIGDEYAMESTRLIPYVAETPQPDGSIYLTYCGTEIPTGISIYFYAYNRYTNTFYLDSVNGGTDMVIDYTVGISENVSKFTSMISRWDFHPYITVAQHRADGVFDRADLNYGDLYIYTTLSPDVQAQMTYASLLSLYNA